MRRWRLVAALCALAALLVTGAGSSNAASKAPDVQLAGVTWEGSLAAAQKKARAAGKPILLLHMLGRLDEEFC